MHKPTTLVRRSFMSSFLGFFLVNYMIIYLILRFVEPSLGFTFFTGFNALLYFFDYAPRFY